MKKNLMFAMFGAIALTGAVGISSCSETEDVSVVNPGYNSETGEVPVNFVFNVSTGNTATTRMTSDNTQAEIATTASQTFRGIDDVQLMSFKLGTTNDGKHVATAVSADKVYGLGTILTKGQLKPASSIATDIKSRRVLELAVPTETNAIMFWGKAIKDGSNFQQGKIDMSIDKNISNNAFSLVKIVPNDAGSSTPGAKGSTAFEQYQRLIAAVLTKIVQSSISTTVTFKKDANSDEETFTGTMRWIDYVTVTASSTGVISKIEEKTEDPAYSGEGTKPMCALGEILAKSFVTLNTINENTVENTTELRAGSASDVARTMGDLYNSLESVSSATPTSLLEAVAQNVGSAIVDNIESAFKDVVSNCAWRSGTETELNKVKIFSGLATGDITQGSITTDNVKLVTTDLAQFPKNFDLPLGSVILTITQDYTVTTGPKPLVYSYMGTIPTYAMGGTTGSSTTNFDPQNYVYPAELCYFGNSPVRVSDAAHETKDYPDGVANWDTEAKWTGWEKSKHVKSTTRSVAMQENINYGTALLKTTVRYGAASLQDNNYYIQSQRTGATEPNATFNVQTNGGLFTLTGILVGGQEQTMGWNYVAKAGESATFGCMVYDKDIPDGTIPAYSSSSTPSAPCYTLLWDNWDQSKKGQKQRDVYVAVEFRNDSGKDFWGENNLIRNGGTFYITGKLDPDNPGTSLSTDDRAAGITWPLARNEEKVEGRNYYALPPYNENGSTIKERRVFIQDYMTTANFVLNEYSLQHALVSVPDLRSSQISLGLSVDLKWETGLNFNNVILGSDETGHTPTP